MSNTRFNEAGILILDSETQAKIVGTENADFLEMFGSKNYTTLNSLTISSDLLPSFNVETISDIAKEQAEEMFPDLQSLLDLDSSKDFTDIICKLFLAAKPGLWTRIDLVSLEITYNEEIPADEQACIFDVETFVKVGNNLPIIGQALSSTGLHLWLHQSFDGITEYESSTLKTGNHKRVLVAHNAAFDYARIKERFQIECPVSVIDTQSMVNCLYGVDSANRWALMTEDGKNSRADFIKTIACAQSLVASYNFVCKGFPPLQASDKKTRNIFVEAETFQEFIDNAEELITYSLLDVIYTHRLFKELYPRFIEWSNGYEILVGQAIVANSILPVWNKRDEWLNTCQDLVNKVDIDISSSVLSVFEDLHEAWLSGMLDLDSHISLSKLDWKLMKPKGWRKKTLPEGWPKRAKWFHDFISGEMTYGKNSFAHALQLEFNFNGEWKQIYNNRGFGWCSKSNEKVPHASGDPEQNLGEILSTDSLRFFDDYPQPLLRSKTLEYSDEKLYEILRQANKTTIWTGFSERFKSVIIDSY